MEIADFIKVLTDQIYGALPLREEGTPEENLMDYVNSVCINAVGYQELNRVLKLDKEFQNVINILVYLSKMPVSDRVFRRELLTATNTLNKIENKYGGEGDV